MAVRLISVVATDRLDVGCGYSKGIFVVDAGLLALVGSVLDALIGTAWDELLGILAATTTVTGLGVVVSGTAANGKHPEETASDGECGCDPGGCEEGGVQGGLNAVDLCH